MSYKLEEINALVENVALYAARDSELGDFRLHRFKQFDRFAYVLVDKFTNEIIYNYSPMCGVDPAEYVDLLSVRIFDEIRTR